MPAADGGLIAVVTKAELPTLLAGGRYPLEMLFPHSIFNVPYICSAFWKVNAKEKITLTTTATASPFFSIKYYCFILYFSYNGKGIIGINMEDKYTRKKWI